MRQVLLLVSLLTYGYTNVCNITSFSKDEQTNWINYKISALLQDDTGTSISPFNAQIIRNYYGLYLSDRGLMSNTDTSDILLQLITTNAKFRKMYYEYTPSACYWSYCYCSHCCNPYHFNYYSPNGIYYDSTVTVETG